MLFCFESFGVGIGTLGPRGKAEGSNLFGGLEHMWHLRNLAWFGVVAGVLGGGCPVEEDPSTGTVDASASPDASEGPDSSGVGDAASDAGGSSGNMARCEALCDGFVQADCDNGADRQACEITCGLLASAPACETQYDAYFGCAESAEVICSSDGTPVAEGCDVAFALAIACAVTESPSPDLVTPCNDYCAANVGAGCANTGTMDDCVALCQWNGAEALGCKAEWTSFIECGVDAETSCLLGFTAFAGCGEDYTDYLSCVAGS